MLPMGGVLFQPNENWTVYASYSESYVPADPDDQDMAFGSHAQAGAARVSDGIVHEVPEGAGQEVGPERPDDGLAGLQLDPRTLGVEFADDGGHQRPDVDPGRRLGRPACSRKSQDVLDHTVHAVHGREQGCALVDRPHARRANFQ